MAKFRQRSAEIAEGSSSNSESDETDCEINEADLFALTSDDEGDVSGTEKVKKRRGRKSHWDEEMVNDLIDIILENDEYKSKLILKNRKKIRTAETIRKVTSELKKRCADKMVEMVYTWTQVKSKIERCKSSCRTAALTMKTASGITRFQESKGLGTWFPKLLPVVMSNRNCQPNVAVEPGIPNEESCVAGNESNTSAPANERSFVPMRQGNKSKNQIVADTMVKISNTIDGLTEHLEAERQTSRELLDHIKEESKRQARRDEEFMSIFKSMVSGNNSTNSLQLQQPSTSGSSLAPLYNVPYFQPVSDHWMFRGRDNRPPNNSTEQPDEMHSQLPQ